MTKLDLSDGEGWGTNTDANGSDLKGLKGQNESLEEPLEEPLEILNENPGAAYAARL